jgi:hypothetical protein
MAQGGKPLEVTGKPGEIELRIAEAVAAGQRAGGAEALERYRVAVGAPARPFVPAPEARREPPTPLDVAAAAYAGEHPEVSAEELDKVLRYIRMPPPVHVSPFLRWLGLAQPGAVPLASPEEALGRQLGPAVEEIRYRQAREEYWRERGGRPELLANAAPAPASQPAPARTTIVNIDSVYWHRPDVSENLRWAEEYESGGGLE